MRFLSILTLFFFDDLTCRALERSIKMSFEHPLPLYGSLFCIIGFDHNKQMCMAQWPLDRPRMAVPHAIRMGIYDLVYK
jgi:hypothetical protein